MGIKGLSQAEARAGSMKALGASVGVTAQTVMRWKIRNRVPLDKAARIERVWGVRIVGNEADAGDEMLMIRAMRAFGDSVGVAYALKIDPKVVRRWIRVGLPERERFRLSKLVDEKEARL